MIEAARHNGSFGPAAWAQEVIEAALRKVEKEMADCEARENALARARQKQP